MNQLSQTQLEAGFEKATSRENLMAKVEELSNVGTWYQDHLTGNMVWSDEMYRIFGYEPGIKVPTVQFLLQHVYPDDIFQVARAFNEPGTFEDINELDYLVIDKNGILKFLNTGHLRQMDSSGKFIHVSGYARDISKVRMLEHELKDVRSYYQASLKNSMSAYFVTNSTGEIIETNDVACKMFGYTNAEFITLSRYQILNDDDPKFIIALQHRKKTGHMKGEVAGIKKNGDSILLEFTSTQFLDANSEQKVISSLRDITSRKLQEETLLKTNERLEHVSKATFDAIWDWDVKSKQLYLGDGFKELFGYEVQSNMADFSTWYNHIHPEDKERIIQSRLNKIIHNTESTWKEEYRYIRANGNVAYIADRGILLRNNTGTYRMIGAMQDVTELKEKEIAISRLNKSLEKRAEELVTSNEELERFAYVASHDLQEPLRMITSFLQLLQSKYNSKLDETAQKYINYAVDGAERMKTLILDLLDYSRISTDKDNHSIINMNELIGKTLQGLNTLVEETDASVMVSILPTVNGNYSQLTRLFQNLISNALKYRSDSRPVIEIGCTENIHEWEFFVKDNGIGVEAKYFDKIFIIFKRLHSRTQYSGTGIGLAICKKIVDLHNGRIWIESTLREGSRFCFTISKLKTTGKVVPQLA